MYTTPTDMGSGTIDNSGKMEMPNAHQWRIDLWWSIHIGEHHTTMSNPQPRTTIRIHIASRTQCWRKAADTGVFTHMHSLMKREKWLKPSGASRSHYFYRDSGCKGTWGGMLSASNVFFMWLLVIHIFPVCQTKFLPKFSGLVSFHEHCTKHHCFLVYIWLLYYLETHIPFICWLLFGLSYSFVCLLLSGFVLDTIFLNY